MQISTMISTRVILSEAELKEAAIEFVKARTEVPTDATFIVEFEDDNAGDLIAVVDITGTAGSAAPASDKPKATRAPKKTTASDAKVDETKVEQAPEPEEKTEDPPFTEDKPTFDNDGFPVVEVAQTEAEPVSADPVPETPKVETKPMGRIFPETKTSAPPPPPAEEVDPTVKAKSLFANLSKPTN